jgi:hypothetical protein
MEVEDIISLDTKYTHAWRLSYAFLHDCISYNYNFDLGTNPRPNPPTVTPHENMQYGNSIGEFPPSISNWFFKLPIAKYNYVQLTPSYRGLTCYGIFQKWAPAQGNQIAELEYFKNNHTGYGGSRPFPPDRRESTPIMDRPNYYGNPASLDARNGGSSASPAYQAGGITYQRPALAGSPLPYPQVYEGVPAYPSDQENSTFQFTYNNKMTVSDATFVGRTYTGYIRYLKQYYAWYKYDEYRNGFSPIVDYLSYDYPNPDGIGTPMRLGSWLVGVIDEYFPASMPTEHKIPISYTVKMEDVVGEGYDSSENIVTIPIALELDSWITQPEIYLETVSPDFSTN